MKKQQWIVMVVTMCALLIGAKQAESYPVANSVKYPLDRYIVNSNSFERYNEIGNDKWHLGDDIVAIAGDEVYAMANGIVRYTKYHAPTYNDEGSISKTNYGGVYIIEHDIYGEKVCALYVHMNFATFTKSTGEEVSKGEYLSQIGNYYQNGGFGEHFHFGIRKGAYPDDPYEYIYGDWIFSGYTSEETVLNDWHNPSEFIAKNMVARFLSGAICQPIYDVWLRNGGRDGPGYPFSDAGNPIYVHTWGNTQYLVQNFKNANGEESCIMYNPQTSKAFWIHGGFWQVYRYNYGPLMDLGNGIVLGAPVTDEYTNPDGYTQQDYEGGYMLWDGVEVYVYRWDGVQISAVNLYNLAPIPTLNPLDAHRIEVLIPENLNRAYADVFCEDVFVHRMYEDKYIIEGLEPSTTYHIKLMFYDENGNFLRESDIMIGVTKAEEVATTESIIISVSMGESSAVVQGSPVQDAVRYEYFVNQQVQTTSSDFSAYLSGFDSGTTYQFQVKAYNASGQLIGQSNTVSATAGAIVSMYFSDAPATIGSSSTYSVTLRIDNPTPYPITNVIFSDIWVNQNTSWFVLPDDLGYIYVAPYSSKDITFTFQTLDGWPVAEKIALSASFYADTQMYNNSAFDRTASVWMQVEPYQNWVTYVQQITQTIRDTDQAEFKISAGNESNTPTLENLCHIYLRPIEETDWQFIANPTIRALDAIEYWDFQLVLDSLPAGTYELMVVADPYDLISEPNEDDNILVREFTVVDSATSDALLLKQKLTDHTVLELIGDQFTVIPNDMIVEKVGSYHLEEDFAGNTNGAMKFNDDFGYWRIEPHEIFSKQRHSFIAVYKLENAEGSFQLFNSHESNNRGGFSWANVYDANTFGGYYGTAVSPTSPVSTTKPSQRLDYEKWYMVVGTLTESQKKVYYNGELVASEGAPTVCPVSFATIIGNAFWDGQLCCQNIGTIAEITILDEALTDEEVRNLYEQDYQPYFEQVVEAEEEAQAEAATQATGVDALPIGENEVLRLAGVPGADGVWQNQAQDLRFNADVYGSVNVVDGPNGEAEGGLDLAGNTYAFVSDDDLLTPSEYYFGFLGKFSSFGEGGIFVSKNDANNRCYQFNYKSDGSLQFEFTASPNIRMAKRNTEAVLTLNQLHYILFVMRSDGLEMWVDGICMLKDLSYCAPPNNSADFCLFGGPWDGVIYSIAKDMQVYMVQFGNEAITPEQIAENAAILLGE